MSRPKNLKDILCKSSLPDVPGMNPSDFLTWGITNTHFTIRGKTTLKVCKSKHFNHSQLAANT
jgi:hypothetical protein